jgi:uncharacterized protein involved in exopolysaccharide biosynthesis
VSNGESRIQPSSDGPRPFADYLLILVRWRRAIAVNVLVVVLGTAVLSLLVPAWYTSSGSILPSETGAIDMGLLSVVETTLPGFRMPGVTTPSEVMLAILTSRLVAEEVIRSNDLMDVYGARNMDHAVIVLDHRSRVLVDENGILRIEAESRDPNRAADIVASFIDALERYNVEARSTTGRKTREFVESRLLETERDLKEAEEALAAFQREHASIEMGEQARAAISALAELEARAATTEIELGIARSYASDNHPEVLRLEAEIREYREALQALRSGDQAQADQSGGTVFAPLSSMPALALELARLTRDVEVQSTVYIFLVQQLETAKIQEAKDTPTIQVLDHPAPAELRTRPRRKLMVAIGGLIGLIIGAGMAFLLEFLSSTDKSNPTRRSLDAAVSMLKGDLERIRGRTAEGRE